MFSIVSNNCWSQEFHKAFDIQYTSPFIDILIYGEDFMNLVKNFKTLDLSNFKILTAEESRNYKEKLVYTKHKDCVVKGVLIDNLVEISPIHVKSEEEFIRKWTTRIKRVNYDNLVLKVSKRDSITDLDIMTCINQFKDWGFNKLIVYTDTWRSSAVGSILGNSVTRSKDVLIYSLNVYDEGQVADSYVDSPTIRDFFNY